MWGLMAVTALLGALSLAAWKMCLSPKPCKTRSAARRRIPSGKAPHPTSLHPAPWRMWTLFRYELPQVGAGVRSFLSRRVMERGGAKEATTDKGEQQVMSLGELRFSMDLPREIASRGSAPGGPLPTRSRGTSGGSHMTEPQQQHRSSVVSLDVLRRPDFVPVDLNLLLLDVRWQC